MRLMVRVRFRRFLCLLQGCAETRANIAHLHSHHSLVRVAITVVLSMRASPSSSAHFLKLECSESFCLQAEKHT